MLLVFIAAVWIADAGEHAAARRRDDRDDDRGARQSRRLLGRCRVARRRPWLGHGRSVQRRPSHRGHPVADLDGGPRDAADLGLSRGRRPRPAGRLELAAAALSAPLLAAAYLTYNRAVFIALYAIAVIVGWRIGGGSGSSAGRRDRRRRRPRAVVRLVPRPGPRREQPARARTDSRSPPTSNGSARGPRPVGCSSTSRSSARAIAPTASCRSSSAIRSSTRRTTNGSGCSRSTARSSGSLASAFALTTAVRLARAPGLARRRPVRARSCRCASRRRFNNVFLFNQVTIPAMVLAGTGVARSRATRPRSVRMPEARERRLATGSSSSPSAGPHRGLERLPGLELDRRGHRLSPGRGLHDAGRGLAGRRTVRRPAELLRRPLPDGHRRRWPGADAAVRPRPERGLVGPRAALAARLLVDRAADLARPTPRGRVLRPARGDRRAIHQPGPALGRQPAGIGAGRASRSTRGISLSSSSSSRSGSRCRSRPARPRPRGRARGRRRRPRASPDRAPGRLAAHGLGSRPGLPRDGACAPRRLVGTGLSRSRSAPGGGCRGSRRRSSSGGLLLGGFPGAHRSASARGARDGLRRRRHLRALGLAVLAARRPLPGRFAPFLVWIVAFLPWSWSTGWWTAPTWSRSGASGSSCRSR